MEEEEKEEEEEMEKEESGKDRSSPYSSLVRNTERPASAAKGRGRGLRRREDAALWGKLQSMRDRFSEPSQK